MTHRSEQPIRVGFVMHKMQVAGAEVLVKQIIEQLGDSIDATVFCLDDVGELGYRLREQNVPVIVLDRKPGFDSKVAKRLANEIRTRGIEVLHTHQYTPFFYSALARIRHRAKAKILFTEHGRHFPDVISWKRHTANRLLLNRYADITTACCDFSTKALREIEGFPDAFTLANGVDVGELSPRGDHAAQIELRKRLDLDPSRRYAACIARFHPVKDHATLIRAWARVHERLPDAQLLLVGDGEEKQNIENLIEELSQESGSFVSNEKSAATSSTIAVETTRRQSFPASIRFLGIRNDVGDILRAVDVFTLTSVSEAASLTLLEAMASECASVVTDVGGNAEHLQEGLDGFLTPRGDDEALSKRLVELLSDSTLAQRFGKSARERVQQNFNLSDAVKKYYDLYQQLTSRTSPKSMSRSEIT